MSTHPDAIGYLHDLSTEVNEPWFRMVCDLASASRLSKLDRPTLDELTALYTDRASYIGIKPVVVAAAASAASPAVPVDVLEQLSDFKNFKLLGDALEVSFKKRITLIFGVNSSGKSSLCESFKVLATSEPPNRPLQNVRAGGVATPTFRYKFKNDTAQQTWTSAVGYGARRTTVKYFDTTIAIKNVTHPVEPGRVIVLVPFKLHVFEWVKALTEEFRQELQWEQRDNSDMLAKALAAIRTEFASFKDRPLSAIDDETTAVLAAEIRLGEEFSDQKLLVEKQAAAAELAKAASNDGLRLLHAENRELHGFLTSLKKLLTSTDQLWALNSANIAKSLEGKQVEQEVLARALIPTGGTLDGMLALLRAASPLCEMNEAIGHACPLCKRDLGVPEVALFKRYHELLVGDLEKEIKDLKDDLANAKMLASAVASVDRKEWDTCKSIQPDILKAAKTGSDIVVASCDITKEPTAEAKAALESLQKSAASWSAQMEAKMSAIDAAAKGKAVLDKQLERVCREIELLEYAHAISWRLKTLRNTQGMVDDSNFWRTKLPTITQILKKITEKAKHAHEELVVEDFEARLDAEYKALAEKGMASFGVALFNKGAGATVTMIPQIGGKDIEHVLSEGEQRVHALALFFAELETCQQSVIIFDDPVSSFDYNYITNYCTRLRDFTQNYPSRQIIILTHNWEFFVQLQTTLNQASLNPHLSVQVIENCAVVADYSEKVDDLKKSINGVLIAPGEPSKAIKEDIAGKMRRLIEAVVNTHVFNGQRRQYKQKRQTVSSFQDYIKIVPLLPAEATTLRDLYGKLSVTEHDDPRSAYVNTDKATFQTRYDSILKIETDIEARRP